MTKEDANFALWEHETRRLSRLYDALARLLQLKAGDSIAQSMNRAELIRLQECYGEENVRWMLNVIQEDLRG